MSFTGPQAQRAAIQDHVLFEEQLKQLNRSIALERVGGDLELLREVARIFLDDYPNTVSSIRAAVSSGDAKTLEHQAHNLKGAVSNFGADAAVRAALLLEQFGRAGETNGAEAAVEVLEAALARLKPEMDALIDGTPA